MSNDLHSPWGLDKRYNDSSDHFRKAFDGKVQKISINAGFTCPNRDGNRGLGGCTYCNNKTFQPAYCDSDQQINRQLEEGIAFFSGKYPAMRYLAYFQAYSNTYAPIDSLRKIYLQALDYPGVVGLVIATRPDCLSVEVLDLLSEISLKNYVMIELGVESVKDSTLLKINRGHSFEETRLAILELSTRGLPTCAHLILGLPGESHDDLMEQARVISSLPIHNLKLHQLQIHTGTVMEKEYNLHPERFSLFSVDEYVDVIVDYLEVLRPSIVVERFVSFAPGEMVVAPRWGLKNYAFVAKVNRRLKERDTWQGRLYQD